MKNKNNIKYHSQKKDLIFNGIQIRENPDDAFDNAIKRGMKKPEDWMYMYSKNGKDFFKHCDSRCYKSYPQFGVIEKIKNKIQRER